MSGESKSLTAKEKLDVYADEVENRVRSMSIPQADSRVIDHYLNMTRTEFESLDTQALSAMAFDINAYAYYLNQEINKYRVRVKKCKDEINRLVGHRLYEYNVFGTAEKWLAAIRDNENAYAFAILRDNNEAVVERLSGLSDQLKNIVKSIDNMRYEKRGNNAEKD